MESESFEKPKRGQRPHSKRWLWCCAGCTATVIFFCCSIPLMAMIGIGMVSANEVTETETRTLSTGNLAGAINLEVKNPVGATSIVSDSNADEIEVEIVRRANGISKSEAREKLDNITVDVRQDGDDFIVEVEHSDRSGFPWFHSSSADLRITVPDNEEYNFVIVNNVGGLTVRNVNIADRMTLTNNVGGIEYVGIIGPEGEYKITNNVGGISVEVSQDSSFTLEATADVGGIDLKLTQNWQETEYRKDSPGASYKGTYGNEDADATLIITTNVGGIEIHD